MLGGGGGGVGSSWGLRGRFYPPHASWSPESKRRMCPLRVKVNAWLVEWICDSDDTLVILNVSERVRIVTSGGLSDGQGYGERRPIM
jgi:hypothetical protein